MFSSRNFENFPYIECLLRNILGILKCKDYLMKAAVMAQ